MRGPFKSSNLLDCLKAAEHLDLRWLENFTSRGKRHNVMHSMASRSRNRQDRHRISQNEGRLIMAALNRRAFVVATAASVAAPTVIGAKEVPRAGMDWMSMSLEARNLAYNNGEHVGLDYARTKTESWIAASKALRENRPQHLDLAYAPGERTKWD